MNLQMRFKARENKVLVFKIRDGCGGSFERYTFVSCSLHYCCSFPLLTNVYLQVYLSNITSSTSVKNLLAIPPITLFLLVLSIYTL